MNSDEVSSSSTCDGSSKSRCSEYHDSLSERLNYQRRMQNDELMKLFREKFGEPVIVVDLDRDEKDSNKQKCINAICDSGEDLLVSPDCVRHFYGQPVGSNQLVCRQCFEKAKKFLMELEDTYRAGKSIFDVDFPTVTEVIVVDDEDEVEPFEKRLERANDATKKLYEMVNSPFTEDIFSHVRESFNHQHQVDAQMEWVTKKMNELDETFELKEKELKESQEDLYQWMMKLYAQYKHPSVLVENYEIPYEEMKFPYLPLIHGEDDCIVTGQIMDPGPAHLPPEGRYDRPELESGDMVYAMRASVYSEWVPAIIRHIYKDTRSSRTITHYYVALKSFWETVSAPGVQLYEPFTTEKELVGQLIAYYDPAPVRIGYGARVIAEYTSKKKGLTEKLFLSGMVAEPPTTINKFRYLIFFDDGKVQYVNHPAIRLIVSAKRNIWEHFTPKMQPFIRRFVENYPERAMLKVKKMDAVKIEHRGVWVMSRVIEIDCSLIYLLHLQSKITEWVYRGSTRLHRMWAGVTKMMMTGTERHRGFATRRTAVGPFVQFENVVTDDDGGASSVGARAVAKKSTTRSDSTPPQPLLTRTLYERRAIQSDRDKRDGRVVQKIPEKLVQPRCFRPHACTPDCVSWITTSEEDVKGVNPLSAPVLYGFSRETTIVSSTVIYVAPCGRKLRTIQEVLNYLGHVQLKLSIDMFDFDSWVHIFNEYEVSKDHIIMKDLSFGVENIPISVVNQEGIGLPNYMDYITKRRPHESVNLNLDPEFLVGCDCTDNCQDLEKCACWRLTLSDGVSSNLLEKDKEFISETVGYKYKRLPNMVATGIYECNSQCKCCVKTCLNRVVQHPLKHKLQLFKTKHKGWGTRCINDIPAGTFICVYVGTIFTENVANEEGEKLGDEYFAELDYIEVVEANKEGYEEYINPELPLNECKDDNKDSDDENELEELGPTTMKLRKRGRKQQDSNSEDEDDPDEMETDSSSDSRSKATTSGPVEDEMPSDDTTRRFRSVRSYYGDNESVFIMDAKQAGNIGRYLNHSCDPNIFVQNVFVDTHDLRFPWVAFFALKYIPAGTELTWDYRYEVGSVPGKKLNCYCLAANCRGRLL